MIELLQNFNLILSTLMNLFDKCLKAFIAPIQLFYNLLHAPVGFATKEKFEKGFSFFHPMSRG